MRLHRKSAPRLTVTPWVRTSPSSATSPLTPSRWISASTSRSASLQLRCAPCSSRFSSFTDPRTTPRTVTIDGRTDLHNYYPEAWQKRDYVKPHRRTEFRYTTKRTHVTAKAVATVHSHLAAGQWCYLVTHTTPPDFLFCVAKVGQRPLTLEHHQRSAFGAFLDRLRKEPGYCGHMWTCERHKSGQLHHHVAIRFRHRWNYAPLVVQWSQRYCGSVNGLDVSFEDKGKAAQYVVKAFWYAAKSLGEGDDLPFRWWGTSKIARSVKLADHELPQLFSVASRHPWAKCARVPGEWASLQAAKVSRQYELTRKHRGKKSLLNPCVVHNIAPQIKTT